jgi:hypothetical protein
MISIKRPNLTNTKSQETGETISAATHNIKSHPNSSRTENHFLEKKCCRLRIVPPITQRKSAWKIKSACNAIARDDLVRTEPALASNAAKYG